MKKDLNYVAKVEKAIKEKYGDKAVQNPRKDWDDEKEAEYIEQLKALTEKRKNASHGKERVEINGILVSKKLINKESQRTCPVCEIYSFNMKDDVYMNKFDCCFECYIQYVDGREKRWKTGWRPKINKEKTINGNNT
jgi:hypothetical protein